MLISAAIFHRLTALPTCSFLLDVHRSDDVMKRMLKRMTAAAAAAASVSVSAVYVKRLEDRQQSAPTTPNVVFIGDLMCSGSEAMAGNLAVNEQ